MTWNYLYLYRTWQASKLNGLELLLLPHHRIDERTLHRLFVLSAHVKPASMSRTVPPLPHAFSTAVQYRSHRMAWALALTRSVYFLFVIAHGWTLWSTDAFTHAARQRRSSLQRHRLRPGQIVGWSQMLSRKSTDHKWHMGRSVRSLPRWQWVHDDLRFCCCISAMFCHTRIIWKVCVCSTSCHSTSFASGKS